MDNPNIKDTLHIKIKHINVLFDLLKNKKDTQFIDYLSQINLDELDLNIRDSHNNYLLFMAIATNNYHILEKLTKYDIRFDVLDSEGNSVLYYPIKFHYEEIIHILLETDKKLVGISIKRYQRC